MSSLFALWHILLPPNLPGLQSLNPSISTVGPHIILLFHSPVPVLLLLGFTYLGRVYFKCVAWIASIAIEIWVRYNYTFICYF